MIRAAAWAYNVYYVGMNIGGFLAPLICGTLGEFYGWHWGFGAAGIGMLAGLVIYLAGGNYLPVEPARAGRAAPIERERSPARGARSRLLLAVGLAVTLFRGAYEQVGNTVALVGGQRIDRTDGAFVHSDDLVPVAEPAARDADDALPAGALEAPRGRRARAFVVQKMAIGALIVGCRLPAARRAAALRATASASWLWLAAFFVIFTLGELYILPNGLGLFARLAPPRLGATTIAAWYLAIFTGSLTAGLVGALWSHMSHGPFFVMLGCSPRAALFLLLLDRHGGACSPRTARRRSSRPSRRRRYLATDAA